MTDDEDAIRRWWDEARQRRGLFDQMAGDPDSSGPKADGIPR
jgi:hypothetical protein